MRIQAILRNNASKDQETAIYDMLVTWAKRIPKSISKVSCKLLQLTCYISKVYLVCLYYLKEIPIKIEY